MTVLSIVQGASLALSLPRPTNLSGAATPIAQTMVQLSTMGGKILAGSHDWQILTYTRTFTPLAQITQTGHPPAGFKRFSPQAKIWDVTRRRWLNGPLSQAQWLALISGTVVPTWPFYWTQQGGVLQIWPAPTTDDSFRYGYVSRNWVRPSGAFTDGSQDTAEWVNPTDDALISEDLLLLDLIWRFKQAKQLDYAEDLSTFEREKEKAIARDRGPVIVSTAAAYYEDPFFTNERPYTWPGQVIP